MKINLEFELEVIEIVDNNLPEELVKDRLKEIVSTIFFDLVKHYPELGYPQFQVNLLPPMDSPFNNFKVISIK